jgi:hypothetical protein
MFEIIPEGTCHLSRELSDLRIQRGRQLDMTRPSGILAKQLRLQNWPYQII